MPKPTASSPTDELRAISAPIEDGFRALREAVRAFGPLDGVTRELILIGSLATAGYEDAVKLHAERALDMGVAKEVLIQSVLLTLGITTTLIDATRAVHWIEDAAAGAAQRHPQ